MTMHTGHASAAESATIAVLEAKLLARSITGEEQLELALLHIEPLHDDFRAADILKELLAQNPRHELANLWLAFVYLYKFMDDAALKAAVNLCDDLLALSVAVDIKAAANFLKASALRQLGSEDPVPDLRQSIVLAPDWAANRQVLAKIYEERGDRKAAEDQLRAAIEASRSGPRTDNLANHYFDTLITGRWAHRTTDRLERQMRELRGNDC